MLDKLKRLRERSKRHFINLKNKIFKDSETVSFIGGIFCGLTAAYSGFILQALGIVVVIIAMEWYKSVFCVKVLRMELESGEGSLENFKKKLEQLREEDDDK